MGCPQYESCFLVRLSSDGAGDCATAMQPRRAVEGGDFLFHHNRPFSAVYLISEGAVKTERVTPEGEQLVTGFHFAGDIVGLEAISDTLYPCDAIAIADSRVCKLNFVQLLRLCSSHPDMLSWFMSNIGQHARRKDVDLSWSLGMNGRLRVLRFFMDLNKRLAASGTGQNEPAIMPMKKQDIARYLHITPETLSRVLADLRKQDLLHINRSRFQLPNPARAQQLTQL